MEKKGFSIGLIGKKLLVTMVLMCLIPLAIAGFITNNEAKSKLTEKLVMLSSQSLSLVSDGIDEYFGGLKQVMSIAADNNHVKNTYTSGHEKQMMDFLDSITKIRDDIQYIYLGRSDKAMKIYPYVELPADYDPTSRDWYQNAAANPDAAVITGPYVDVATGDIIITVSRAVFLGDNMVGVLAADCSLQSVSEKISDRSIGSTGYIFAATVDGLIIAHPDKSLIGTNIQDRYGFWEETRSKRDGFLRYKYDGDDAFGAFSTNDNTGWFICTSFKERELDDDTSSIRNATLVVSFVVTFVAAVIAMFIGKKYSSHISRVQKGFAHVADGDLTVRIKTRGRDEFAQLGESFNSMLERISALLSSVVASAETVMHTSTRLAEQSFDVNRAVSDVAHSVDDVSRGSVSQAEDAMVGLQEMENMSAQLDGIALRSNEMNEISNFAKDLSRQGFEIIDGLTEKSERTMAATSEVSAAVDDMYKSSLQISNISDALASITSQTNLLSLNAGIEAARAGDAGRGFGVVANEIRKLAEESRASTEEIKLIIDGIQSKASSVASSIKTTRETVAEQDRAVVDTREIFDRILEAIEKLSAKVAEVVAAVESTNKNKLSLLGVIQGVSSVSEEGAAAVQEVTASTEEISANMDEFTRYAEELKQLAENLGAEVRKFRV